MTEFIPREVGWHDKPQNVCPECGDDDIEASPTTETILFVNCWGCGYQWNEPELSPLEQLGECAE
jgi:hypothetical protein